MFSRVNLICHEFPRVLAICLLAAPLGCGRSNSNFNNDQVYDFGPVFVADTKLITHIFKLKNVEDSNLKILSISRSCNCTEAEMSTKEVEPGASADLKLTIRPNSARGDWMVACGLETDNKKTPKFNYYLKYRTYPHIAFDRTSLNLGQRAGISPKGEESSKRTECRIDLYEPAQNLLDSIASIEIPAPLSYQIDKEPEIERLEAGKLIRGRYRLTIGFDANSSPSEDSSGIHSATITARTRLGFASSLAVIWSLDRPLQISPDAVSFGLVSKAEGTSRKVVKLIATDGRPFRLLTATSNDQGITVMFEEPYGKVTSPRASHLVYLEFVAANRRSKYLSGRVQLTTDHSKMRAVSNPWYAILCD